MTQFLNQSSYTNQLLNSNFITTSFEGVSTPNLYFNNISNFFSPTAIMDIFYKTNSEIFYLINIQEFLNTNTRNFILSLWDLTNSAFYTPSINANLFLTNQFISHTNITGINLHNISNAFVNELHYLTKPKTDPFELIELFPEHQYVFELFEVISINVDNSLYEFLHLPEFKLYYPEPFIASPSFQHEEL